MKPHKNPRRKQLACERFRMATINGTSANQAKNGLPRSGNEAVSSSPEKMADADFMADMS